LQAYLDQMSELLIDKKLHEETAPHSDKRVTARARTLIVLSQLNGVRPGRVLQFLYETRLISREERLENRKIEPRLVGLSGADLRGANCSVLVCPAPVAASNPSQPALFSPIVREHTPSKKQQG
jgi:hypothetical protein